MMSQLIGELVNKQAVDTLVDELARAISDERCCMSRGRSTGEIMQDILDLQPVLIKEHEERKWIPVSERLPEKPGRYLGYIVSKFDAECQYIMACEYIVNGWLPDDECASGNVVAWMSLPEPYKSERNCI